MYVKRCDYVHGKGQHQLGQAERSLKEVRDRKKLMVMLNSTLRGMQAPKPKLSKWAYTGEVRPKLLYASMTMRINTLQQTKQLKALDRCQSLAYAQAQTHTLAATCPCTQTRAS